MATAPIDGLGRPANTHAQLEPLSVVFHTPPAAAPMYCTAGSFSTTARAVIRPPIVAGPMHRACSPGIASGAGGRDGGAAAMAARANTRTARRASMQALPRWTPDIDGAVVLPIRPRGPSLHLAIFN